MKPIFCLKLRVGLLLTKPPKNITALSRRYRGVRSVLQKTMAGFQRADAEKALSRHDTDFEGVRKIFPMLGPGFIKRVGESVLANEYRFFVGGLEAQIKCLSKFIR